MKKFWVSWFETNPESFEYHGPWWVSGEAFDPPRQTICAAVVTTDAEAAKRIIEEAHDDPKTGISEWRFWIECYDNWVPFCDRFPRATWMKWPWPRPST